MNIIIFIKKSSSYLGLSLLGIIIICICFNLFIAKKGYFKINPNIKSVVLGDSHPQCALNDSLISNFKNLSKNGESYFYTHIKTQQVLKQNPQLETIFIAFTNNSIASAIDQQIWNDKYINFSYPSYSAFMNMEERLLLIKKNLKAVISATPVTLKKQTSRIINNNYNYSQATGGYSYETKNNLKLILKKPPVLDKFKTIQINKASVDNLYYLEKIVALCKEKNIQLYFIRTPLHKNYIYLANETLFQNIKKDKFPDIEFLDFKNFPLSNKDYRDLHHLNYKGAKKFSVCFNKLLKNELLKKRNKQKIINDALNKL